MIYHWTSSLEKIFMRHEKGFSDYCRNTALQGEVFSLQLIYKPDFLLNPLSVKVISPLAENIQIRQVYNMPATFFGEERDEFILDDRPGLYPDRLGDPAFYRSAPGAFHSLWLTVRLPGDIPPGVYPIALELTHFNAYRNDRNFTDTTPVFELEADEGCS